MHQWVKEFHTWWPPFRVCILHDTGSYQGSRHNLIRDIGKSSSPGFIVTSFNSILSYKDQLKAQNFDYVILDEGHKIRNPDAQGTIHILRNHFYSKKLSLTSKFFTKTGFFRHNKRISFSTLHFDTFFMLYTMAKMTLKKGSHNLRSNNLSN